jgi:lipopolysaccharide transport system ATP-binding protein
VDNEVIIEVDHVSKKYCKSLKRAMLYGIKDIARNALGICSHSERLRKDEFWAVNDVSFEVKRGETLGIIGPNGAGKTTLLKMLNGIFWPDRGRITIYGKVGALIAVGAGFHPMLTGRENIYLNGAVLGMSKCEIDKKFDEIVGFADIGDFLDTPVKFYSSGMFVRLGFAIAAYCEPDVLLVDEVLAVGDIGFRTRCFDRMNWLCNSGTTIVLVSHNLKSIRQYATKTLFINHGQSKFLGNSQEACEKFTLLQTQQIRKDHAKSIVETALCGYQIPPVHSLENVHLKTLDSSGNETRQVILGEKMEFHFSFFYHGVVDHLQIGIIIYKEGLYLAGIDSLVDGLKLSVNNELFSGFLKIDRVNLVPGKYTAVLALLNHGKFLLRGFGTDFTVVSERVHAGFIDLPHKWDIQGKFGN